MTTPNAPPPMTTVSDAELEAVQKAFHRLHGYWLGTHLIAGVLTAARAARPAETAPAPSVPDREAIANTIWDAWCRCEDYWDDAYQLADAILALIAKGGK